ncbi:MAG: pyrroline-5-carboxylate reductase [Chloroflexota bacterium]
MKIAFIGGGNMGEALIASLLSRGVSAPEDIIASDISESRCRYLEERYRIATTSDNRAAVAGRDMVVLAVKPQVLPGVMVGLKGALKPAQLVLSIIAGATVKTLVEGLGHRAVVRVMPNTPAQIDEGISVWTTTDAVTPQQRELAGKVLGVTGEEIYVPDEALLDMATAVSGSGPAYFFYFVEALADAAADIGLPPDIAARLVMQTFLGSAHLLQKSGKTPAELRKAVTSPGGTTAAALQALEQGQFPALVTRAVRAALRRAQELGR